MPPVSAIGSREAGSLVSFAMLGGPRFYFIGVVPVPVATKPPQVLDAKQDAPVVLASGQDVYDAPKAGPATAAHGADVPGDQAGGGFDDHIRSNRVAHGAIDELPCAGAMGNVRRNIGLLN